MNDDNYQRGLDKMMEFTVPGDTDAATHVKIAENLRDLAPDVPRYMIEFAFGEIYTRPGLTREQQVLVTIASLVTLGTDPQIELHINTAVTIGLTKQQIVAAIVHLIPYIGFPRVLNALEIVQKVLEQRGVEHARD